MLVLDDEVPEVDEVDAKLVALARKLQLRLLTNDVNLAKVAEIQGVPAIIPRRLAADLIPGVLAGETLVVSLNRPGRHPGQGVGFLDDGSMVVVNGGEDLVGAGPVSLVVSSIVPTSAGRMVFARPNDPRLDDRAGRPGRPEPRPSAVGDRRASIDGWRPGRSSLRPVRAPDSAGPSSSSAVGSERLVDRAVQTARAVL